MNALDMHIEVKLSTQQVNANAGRKWYDDEISWVLTKMQDRFIRNKLKPKQDKQGNFTGGFEIDQVGVDDISSLIVTGATAKAYIVDDTRYKVYLPHNYQYLLSDSSKVVNLCGATPVVATENLYIKTLRQTRSAKVSAPYYETIISNIGSKTVSIPTDLPYGNQYAGYRGKEEVGFIAPYIALKGGWYWEKGAGFDIPGTYIAMSNAVMATAYTTVDGINYGVITSATNTEMYHSATGTLIENRLLPSHKIQSMNGVAYWKTAHYAPISELIGNTLYVYRDNSFTVNGVVVTYIRKPQPISLSLGTDCELPEGAHQSICDMATEYIKGTVNDQAGLQLKSADIANRVVL